jgi:hypothetical protein
MFQNVEITCVKISSTDAGRQQYHMFELIGPTEIYCIVIVIFTRCHTELSGFG